MNLNLKLLKNKGVFEHEDDYVMYILINSNITMDISQLISQCCESIIKVTRLNEQKYVVLENYYNWIHSDETKIFLKATQEDLLYAINNYSSYYEDIWCQHTLDLNENNNNKTPFTVTCVAFTPIQRKNTPKFILDLDFL